MKICIVDIETTGFLKEGGFICEVGIAQLDTSSGEVRELFDSVCREGGMTWKIKDAWIFKNSDLKLEDVRSAPDLTTLKPHIELALSGCDAVTAYNKSFDFDFLRSRGFKLGEELPCPMKALTPIAKIIGRRGGFKWPSVEEAWNFFFPFDPYIEAHRGFDDAKHEALIVWELIKLGAMGLTQDSEGNWELDR